MIDERLNGRFLSERGRLRHMVLPSGCTMCAGSGVMCRVKRGTFRNGVIGNFACTFFGKGKWTLFRKGEVHKLSQLGPT